MSLVPTYVQSRSGRWYKNPVIRRPGWFICWDDHEPIELVIEEGGPKASDVLAELKAQGWSLKVISRARRSERLFDGKFRPARAYFLQQLGRGPTDEMLAGNPSSEKRPMGDCVYYEDRLHGYNE